MGPFCAVQTPVSWKSAITSGQVTADGTWSRVFALSPNGNQSVKEVLRGSIAYLELASRTGKQQTITNITNITNTQAGGFLETADFDGRWVVYVLGYDQNIANRWAIYAWDSHSTGAPHKIATSRSGAHFTLDPQVKVHQGKATWIASTGNTDALEVHLFDLAADRDLVVESAHISGFPFFADNLLVWSEWKAPSDPPQVKAYDIVSGAMTNLPDALKTMLNSASFASNGRTWAWIDATSRQVWAWRTDWTAPTKIFYGGQGSQVTWLQIAGDLVTWSGIVTLTGKVVYGVYAADLRAGSYVKLTPDYGSSMAKGTFLEFSYATTKTKSQYIPQVSFVVDVSKLPPLPTCSASK